MKSSTLLKLVEMQLWDGDYNSHYTARNNKYICDTLQNIAGAVPMYSKKVDAIRDCIACKIDHQFSLEEYATSRQELPENVDDVTMQNYRAVFLRGLINEYIQKGD